MKTSVALCTYNGVKYIAAQLKSILNQSIQVDEIIISDDGSSDDTIKVVKKELEKTEISYQILEHDKSRNVSKTKEGCIAENFQNAILACSGDIIFLADQDDLWKENKVEFVLRCFLNNPQCVMVFSDASVINENNELILPSLHKKQCFMQAGYTQKVFHDGVIRLSHAAFGCTCAIRRNFALKILPFPDTAHDAWITCTASFFGEACALPERLMAYRIHGENNAGFDPKGTWASEVRQRDRYDQHFYIHTMKHRRIAIFREAQKRLYTKENSASRRYCRSIDKAVSYYNFISSAKSVDQRWRSAMGLLRSFAKGEYWYRFCDRGKKVTAVHTLKQLCRDILFMLRWEKQ